MAKRVLATTGIMTLLTIAWLFSGVEGRTLSPRQT